MSVARNTIAQDYTKIANLLSEHVSEMISGEITDINRYLLSMSVLPEAIRERRLRYEAMSEDAILRFFTDMDQKWTHASDGSSLIKEYLENKASIKLREFVKARDKIAEIFVTDKLGGLVASSGKTSDFYQADEKWWQKSFADGKGRVFIGGIAYDRSSRVLAISISVPIKSSAGQVIGIGKAVVNIKRFMNQLEKFRIGKTGHVTLIDKKDFNIIFHHGIEPMTMKLLGREESEKLLKSKAEWMISSATHSHSEKIFFAWADVRHPALMESGITWLVCIMQNPKEILGPLKTLFLRAGMLFPFLILIMIPLSLVFGGIFVKPIKKLGEGTEQIAKGNLDYKVGTDSTDEIGALSRAFDRMTENLKKSTISIGELNKEVTIRKKAEEALRKSEEKFRSITVSALDAILMMEPEGNISLWNPAAEKMFGYTVQEAVGMDLHIFLASERDYETVRKGFAKFKKTGKGAAIDKTIELEAVRKDGTEFPIELSLSALQHKDKWEAVGIMRDITNRKKAEKQLKAYSKNMEDMVQERTNELHQALTETEEARKKLNAVIKSMADGLFVTDAHNRIIMMNRVAEKYLSVRLDEVINRPIDIAITDRDLSDRIKNLPGNKKTEEQFDFKLPGIDLKHPRIMRARTSAIQDGTGEHGGTVTTIRDVTFEHEVDRMKTEFISTAAHELRTPLTSVLGFSEILMTRDDIKEEEKKKLSPQSIQRLKYSLKS